MGIAAIPFGGGSSVVGGVESAVEGYAGVVSVDVTRLDRVLEVDRTSRAARIQAGTYGPALEDSLRPHGLTLRHFPQSFEFSTLGGWLATRAGGHFATRYTHIDDFCESLRVVTPHGTSESRRLPGSGAGPSHDRLFLGSEGAFGVITEAWMRLQDRPTYRSNASVVFPGFESAVEATRALSQSGLEPANCRLLDPGEAAFSAGGDGKSALLVLAFESADHALDAWMQRAVEICRAHGADVPDDAVRTRTDAGASREGAAGAWRNSFVAAPYARDALVAASFISETFETAITWDRFADFHANVSAAVQAAIDRVCGSGQPHLSLHPRLPGRPRPLLHDHRAQPTGRRAGALGRDQAGRGRRGDRERRNDHAPPRCRTGPPPLVRPPAIRGLRGSTPRGEVAPGSGRHHESGCARRSLALEPLSAVL